jgi:uncharacterized integral membrane protein
MTQEPQPEPQSILQRIGARGIAGIVITILVIIFIAENTRRVKIRFIVGSEVNTPVWLALVITALLGVLAGYLVQILRSRR